MASEPKVAAYNHNFVFEDYEYGWLIDGKKNRYVHDLGFKTIDRARMFQRKISEDSEQIKNFKKHLEFNFNGKECTVRADRQGDLRGLLSYLRATSTTHATKRT